MTVDSRAVLRPRSDLAEIEIDGEIIVFDDRKRRLHRLNSPAALIWASLDGSTSLAAIAIQIADDCQVDPAQVLEDLLSTVDQLIEEGLLTEG